jgi:hypothetical protein
VKVVFLLMITKLKLKYFKKVFNLNKRSILLYIFILIPLITLFLGFAFNEDLSTGGASWDFNLTWPVVVNYSSFNFFGADQFTRHMPLHYTFLALLNIVIDDAYFVRLFYLFFSLLLPFFLYLNLSKIYDYNKITLLIFSFSFLYIPLFRSSAIWSNSHLTATIFFLIGNYFYLKSKNQNNSINSFLNLLFLAFAIYSLQTYLILFLYYLYNYFLSEKFNTFIKLFLFSCLLGLPGLYFIVLNSRIANITYSHDIFYTLSTNFSLIFFNLSFLLFNNETFKIFINKIKNLTKIEICAFFFLVVLIFYNQSLFIFDSRLRGGGFFYKLSFLMLNNNLIFIISSLLGLIAVYIAFKYEHKILYIILIINLMALNIIIYQKYFEPLFLIIIAILYKNFLIDNILKSLKNTLIFYSLILFYFLIAQINTFNNFSLSLII